MASLARVVAGKPKRPAAASPKPKRAAPAKPKPKRAAPAKPTPKRAAPAKPKPKRAAPAASKAKKPAPAAKRPTGNRSTRAVSGSPRKGKARPAGEASGSGRSQSPKAARAAGGSLGAGLVDLRRSTEPPPKPPERRSVGLRGAAPWVARHAAKHAAELRARNAEPAPPGSARATLRTPAEAEQIKARIAQLHQQTTRIRSMCRRLDRHFYEVGQLLADIQQQELHLAKGYSSFEAFLDRELDIGRAQALRLVRIAHTFLREMAYDYGLERLVQALAALDGELAAASPSQPSNRSFSSPGLPARPPIRFGD